MALIGFIGMPKADGSQTTDLHHDALMKTGSEPVHLYENKASGK